jgi:DNA-binding MarR family transcriptional regulator
VAAHEQVSDGGGRRGELVVDVEPLVAASRVISAVVVRSLARVDPSISVPTLRVLVMVGQAGSMSMGEIADGLGVNPSNASRSCDRLLAAGLILREEHPEDRRRVVVELTPAGERLIADVMRHRADELAAIVSEMSPEAQRELMSAMDAFRHAAGEDRRTDALVGDLVDRRGRRQSH